jgi:hypothetical protein
MKRIFIGSSSEALPQAEMVAAALAEVPNVTPVLWTEIFKAGDITFLSIEELASNVSGAVFVVTPDDDSIIRGQHIKTPRANVVFEYGYLTSRLTRHRVALCRYTDAILPSDWAGITHIPMGVFEPQPKFEHNARFTLKSWAAELPSLQPTLSATALVHGYSGTWRCQAVFSKWRGLQLKDQDFVIFNADVVLLLPTDGKSGRGSMNGTLEIQVDGCYAQFLRSDNIINATVQPDGSLRIQSIIQSRQLMKIDGKHPQKDGFESHLRGSREVDIELLKLKPDKGWQGTYTTLIADKIVSIASARFTR